MASPTQQGRGTRKPAHNSQPAGKPSSSGVKLHPRHRKELTNWIATFGLGGLVISGFHGSLTYSKVEASKARKDKTLHSGAEGAFSTEQVNTILRADPKSLAAVFCSDVTRYHEDVASAAGQAKIVVQGLDAETAFVKTLAERLTPSPKYQRGIDNREISINCKSTTYTAGFDFDEAAYEKTIEEVVDATLKNPVADIVSTLNSAPVLIVIVDSRVASDASKALTSQLVTCLESHCK